MAGRGGRPRPPSHSTVSATSPREIKPSRFCCSSLLIEAHAAIIDLDPQASAALKVARAADLVLIPYRTAILDLEAITDTVQFIATTGTPALVVLNAVSLVRGHELASVIIFKNTYIIFNISYFLGCLWLSSR